MSEYSSLKVPELKKLLAEKSLPQTGNKADLIARLQEHDKQADSAEGNQVCIAQILALRASSQSFGRPDLNLRNLN